MASDAPPQLAKMKSFDELQHGYADTSSGSRISYFCSPEGTFGDKEKHVPVLLLIHGYPQASYMWRNVIPQLAEKFRLFIPDLPGYGHSTPVASGNASENSSRRVIGHSIAQVLHKLYGPEAPVILGGHDRGARTVQRMAVSLSHRQPPFDGADVKLNVKAAIMLDIVPYAAQWEAFKNPRAAVAYFHWSFLPHPFAIPMMKAYGPGKLTREMVLGAISGDNKDLLASDGAVDYYASLFERESNLQAAVDDYVAGSTTDYDEQLRDQMDGKKIVVPSLVMYSAKNLGRMHDVPAVWKDWFKEGTDVEMVPAEDGVGHYIPEEAPQKTVDAIIKFLDRQRLVTV